MPAAIPPHGPMAPPLPRPANGPTPAETARDFEAVFLGQVSRIMMETVDPGAFSGGHAETMMQSIMAEQVGREMARRGGIGIAPVVLDQIIALQGGADKDSVK
jgi:peptidoglycan hydrolase FlgJ